ncbi:MAG: ComEC/Rec2 family competence protein, partial [Brevinema sp.]
FRIDLSLRILEYYPQSGSLILALVLGNRYFLDQEFIEYIRFSGLAHILALSGLHLIIFVGFFIWLLTKMGITQRFLGVLTLPLSIGYLFLGGLGISLQRAVLFHFLGSCFQFYRIPIPATKIFLLAFLINILIIPSNAYTLSFWLSYISVLGIVYCYKFWYDMLVTVLGKTITPFLAVSIAASVMVMPILIWFFGVINIFSVIASFLIVPMMPFVLICCFTAVLFGSFKIGFEILDNIIALIYQFIFETARFFSEIPYGVIFFNNRLVVIWGVLFNIVLISCIIKKRDYEFME